MNKQQLLMDISLEVDTFNAHLKRLSKSDYPLHNLDVDFLQEKIRLIYERILDLEQFVEVKKPVAEKPAAAPEKTETGGDEKFNLFENDNNETLPVEEEIGEHEDTGNEADEQRQAEDIREKTVEIDEKVTETEESNTEPEKMVDDKKEESPKVIKTTLDLFSEMPSETLSDKISGGEELSVADRLQKSQIGDLREAIGINEKFQFINELFNGDMTRYNKAIDELNGFVNLEGAKTYLFELSVENQWSNDLPALIKLNELLERKFA